MGVYGDSKLFWVVWSAEIAQICGSEQLGVSWSGCCVFLWRCNRFFSYDRELPGVISSQVLTSVYCSKLFLSRRLVHLG